MLGNSRAFAVGLLAIMTPMMMAPLPAVAQSGDDSGHLIQASNVFRYSRYYAPYAIQAAAAYIPVGNLDAASAQPAQNGYGADVNYAAEQIFTDETVRKRTREALKAWKYQFGSESYCSDRADSRCLAPVRKRRWFALGGPSFQIWSRSRRSGSERDACNEISIVFRGTSGSLTDWLSNGHQIFGGFVDDYYSQLRRSIDSIISSVKELDCYKRAASKPQIVSAGHSLGGGLAQLAALANNPNGAARITKVFAFDPSPVTGADLVDRKTRAANARGLTIDRIYQQGEALSYLRGVDQQYPPAGSICDPVVRTVRVDAVPPGSPVQLHGMPALAGQLVQLSYLDDETRFKYQAPSDPANCGVRYEPRNGAEPVVASIATRRIRVAARNGARGFAEPSLFLFAAQPIRPVAEWRGRRLHRVVAGSRPRRLRVAASL